MFNLEDDERRRLARKLYDTIAQNVAALIMDLALVIDTYPFGVRSDLSECLSRMIPMVAWHSVYLLASYLAA